MRFRLTAFTIFAAVLPTAWLGAQSVEYRAPSGVTYRSQADTGPRNPGLLVGLLGSEASGKIGLCRLLRLREVGLIQLRPELPGIKT